MPDKAYWLGFLVADGCLIAQESSGNRVNINISGRDRHHLEKYVAFLGGNNELIKTSRHSITGNEIVTVDLCSKKVYDKMLEYGLTPRKSGNEHFVKTNFNSDFIRGLIDGDGYIREDLTGIGLVGSYSLLKTVQEVFLNEIGVVPKKIHEHGSIFKIEYRGK